MAFSVALKSIVGSINKEGYEPFTSYDDPDSKIDAVVSPNSTASRMVMDAYMQLYTNKALIEFTKQIKDELKK